MEKVIRFSGEDAGLGDRINRFGDQMRDAFSKGGFGDILSEADAKFTSFRDKLAFIRQELASIKEANKTEYDDDIAAVNRGGGNQAYKNAQRSKIGANYEKQQTTMERLIDALNKFSGGVEKKTRPGYDGVLRNRSILDAFTQLLQGNVGGAIGKGGQAALTEAITRNGENMSTGMRSGLLATGALLTAAIAGLGMAIKRGYDDLKSENSVRRMFDIGDDFADNDQLSRVGLSRKEFRNLAAGTAQGRKSANNIESEVIQREFFKRGFYLNDQDIQGFDRFYRQGSDGRNRLDIGGMDATQTIVEILVRADRQGILGVSKGDFSALPEKIALSQSILQMQYGNGERVDANAAINMVLAGQRIGGRFADDRLGESMGRIDGSIKNPSNPGMRAFIFQLLKQTNPNSSYTDILGQMENGASSQNLQAILPSIANMPQGEMRRMVLFQLTKNMQDAIRLDQAGNLQAMLSQLKEKPMTDAERQSQFGQVQKRADERTTEWERTWQYLGNKVGETTKEVSRLVEWVMKHPPSSIFTGSNGTNTSGLPNTDFYNQNGVVQGSTSGEAATQKN